MYIKKREQEGDMRKTLVAVTIVIFFSVSVQCQIVHQVRIPLSNERGVPFDYGGDPKGDYITGFDVDSQGNYFFLAGYPAILVKMAPDGKIIYRKTYTRYMTGMTINDNYLYVFNAAYDSNTLTVLKTNNGEIVRQFSKLTPAIVNDLFWGDSILVLELQDKAKIATGEFQGPFEKFSLKGKPLGTAFNMFNLPDSIYNVGPPRGEGMYLGRIDRLYIYQNYATDRGNDYEVVALNSNGGQVGKVYLTQSSLGVPFLGLSQNWRLRDGNIYILTKKGKDALVTQLSVRELLEGSSKNK